VTAIFPPAIDSLNPSFDSLILLGSISGEITLSAPSTVTSYSLVFPSAQGGSGQSLINDGAGNLSWETVGTTFPLYAPDGSVSAPSYSYNSDHTSGLWWDSSAPGVTMSDGGVNLMLWYGFGNTINLGNNNASIVAATHDVGALGVRISDQAMFPFHVLAIGTGGIHVGVPSGVFTSKYTSGNMLESTDTAGNPQFGVNQSTGVVQIGASSTTPEHVLNTSTSTPASGVGTLTNLPTGASGNPTGYIKININGSDRVIPFW
jgi:hypothetical protein